MKTVDYFKYDWDILFIFDACRVGAFEKLMKSKKLRGKMEVVNSGAVATPFWYALHWAEPRKVHLVSSNPHPFIKTSRFAHKNFLSATRAWKSDRVDPRHTLDVFWKKYTEGKWLVHIMPPHLPYIGEKGAKFMEKFEGEQRKTGVSFYRGIETYGRENGWEELKGYYQESLEKAFDIVKPDLDKMRAKGLKVIITSDHSELIGEQNIYDHNDKRGEGLRELLTTVPLLKYEGTDS